MQDQSRKFIPDEIKTELLRYFRSAHASLIDICTEHAALIVEVGRIVHEAFLHIG